MNNDNNFDCLALKQTIQEKMYQEMKEMNHAQQIEYLTQQINQSNLKNWWNSLKSKTD